MNPQASLRHFWNVNITGRLGLRALRWWAEAQSSSHWQSPSLAPPLRISPRMKELIGRHWLEGRYANLTRKVAWVTSGAPVEILKALDFYVLYPENHGAICGTARLAVDLCSEAEKGGYSPDLCSYARTDFGTLLSGKTPVGRLPRPDLLLACTNICQTVLAWYQVLAHHFEIPLVLIDTPFLYREEAPPHALDFVEGQLEQAILSAERVAGRSMREAAFRRTAERSKIASELWMQILERNRHHPAPISVFDQFIQMAPIVELRGDAATIDFYAAMLRELDQRIARGVGAVQRERRRLLWDNLPIWHRLRWLAELLGKHGIAVVASTYTNAWGELAALIDPQHPLRSMARVYAYPILNRGTGHKLATMQHMIEKYDLDGAILHSDRSCKPYSMGQMDQRERLARELHKPALLLEADHNDARVFSEDQVCNQLQVFIEMLENLP
jgi:benzoyl-CoA reductase/2-hydroxyglutaryl-CoA dehydratase subunit BcrC/BadD/HgdB